MAATTHMLKGGRPSLRLPGSKPCGPRAGEDHGPSKADQDQDHDYVLELIHGFLKTQVLHTGVSMGVFEVLHENRSSGWVSLSTLAQRLQTPPENAEKLLNALAALKLVSREHTTNGVFYKGTNKSTKYLTRTSPVSLVPVLDMAVPMISHMGRLGESLKTVGWFSEMELIKDYLDHKDAEQDNKENVKTKSAESLLIEKDAAENARNKQKSHEESSPPSGPPIRVINGLHNNAKEGKCGSHHTTNGLRKEERGHGNVIAGSRGTNHSNGHHIDSDKKERKPALNGKQPQNGKKSGPDGNQKAPNGVVVPSNGTQGPPGNCFEAMAGQLEMLMGFQLAMNAFAVNACHLMEGWNLDHFSSAVDLGGGLGTFGRYLAAKHPTIETTIYDVPPVVEIAKNHRTEIERTRKNLKYRAGDFFSEELPEADIYILGHILHDWPESQCNMLLQKVHKALKPGGVVLILEKLVNDSRDGPLSAALLNLVIMMSTPGEERTLEQYSTLLQRTGFRLAAHRADSAYNWYDVIVAKKA